MTCYPRISRIPTLYLPRGDQDCSQRRVPLEHLAGRLLSGKFCIQFVCLASNVSHSPALSLTDDCIEYFSISGSQSGATRGCGYVSPSSPQARSSLDKMIYSARGPQHSLYVDQNMYTLIRRLRCRLLRFFQTNPTCATI